MIHQAQTKEIKNVSVAGYLILIGIDFSMLFLRFLLSFSFDWEQISNTHERV